MAWANVQNGGTFNAAAGTTAVQAFGSNVVAGNLLIVFCVWVSSTTATCAVTDSQGNTYTGIAATLATNSTQASRSQIFVATAGSSAADTVTMTTSASVGERVIAISEWTGLSGSTSAVLATSGATANPAANITSVSAATSLLAACSFTGGTETVGSGWTSIANGDGNQAQYKLAGATGTISVPFVEAAANQWTISAAEFLISGAVTEFPPPILVMAPPLPSV